MKVGVGAVPWLKDGLAMLSLGCSRGPRWLFELTVKGGLMLALKLSLRRAE
jgi:hypothetical protein